MITNCYRLSEYQSLSGLTLAPAEAEELAANFAGQLDVRHEPAGRYTITAHQYVGVIALKDTRIAIEPKTPITNLAHMLSAVYDLIEWQSGEAAYGGIEQWCELVAALFVTAVETVVSGGLLRGYRDVSENIALVKGQIDLASQFSENLANPARHRCNYADFSVDLPENQLIKLALERASLLTGTNGALHWRIERARAAFAAVSLPTRADFDLLVFTRLNEHYRRPLTLARMIVESSAPTLAAGGWPLAAFLVDMNRLFERYVAHRLNIAAINYPQFTLRYQTRDYLDNGGGYAIVPDIVVVREGRCEMVIDTKYKLSGAAGDYYQMIAYALALSSSRARLVYPAWEGARPPIAVRNSNIVVESLPVTLQGDVATLDSSIDKILCDSVVKNS